MSQWYEHVDIKFSAHGAFLEQRSTGGAHNRKTGKPNNYNYWKQHTLSILIVNFSLFFFFLVVSLTYPT